MRVVVVGATGNVGSAFLDALADFPEVTSVLGVARRKPSHTGESARRSGVEWVSADIRSGDLTTLFRGADAVVHLAWLFQPTHRPLDTWGVNVAGTSRVLDAVAQAGVPTLAYASSVGAYSPRDDDVPVTEEWPTEGWAAASYMVEKSYVERLLDIFEGEHPECRVVRMRPAFSFQDTSASEQRRLFAGPFTPNPLLRPGRLPVLPYPRGLRLQVVHSADVGRAYALAIVGNARGPFNLAADPVLDRETIGGLLRTRTVTLPAGFFRGACSLGWRLRLLPATPALFDGMMHLPIMDTTRAARELGWNPRFSAVDTLTRFLEAFADGTGGDTPPLDPAAGGVLRYREIVSGVGQRDPVDRLAAQGAH